MHTCAMFWSEDFHFINVLGQKSYLEMSSLFKGFQKVHAWQLANRIDKKSRIIPTNSKVSFNIQVGQGGLQDIKRQLRRRLGNKTTWKDKEDCKVEKVVNN